MKGGGTCCASGLQPGLLGSRHWGARGPRPGREFGGLGRGPRSGPAHHSRRSPARGPLCGRMGGGPHAQGPRTLRASVSAWRCQTLQFGRKWSVSKGPCSPERAYGPRRGPGSGGSVRRPGHLGQAWGAGGVWPGAGQPDSTGSCVHRARRQCECGELRVLCAQRSEVGSLRSSPCGQRFIWELEPGSTDVGQQSKTWKG